MLALAVTLATTALAAPSPSPKLASVPARRAGAITHQTDPSWNYYESEPLCLAAGWDICENDVVDGDTKWAGFKVVVVPPSKTYPTEEQCLVAGHSSCLLVQRGDGSSVWFGQN